MPRSASTALQTVRQWQSETDSIREASEPVGARLTIFVLAAMIVCLVGITPFMQLDRVVMSQSGTVVSAEGVTTFQALDPSLIKSINVKEGQQVTKGQLLATLDPTFAAADVNQLRQQIASLDAQITRAQAELAHKPLVFPVSVTPDEVPYVELQTSLYSQRAAEEAAGLRSFDEKIKTTEATIAKLQADQTRYLEREKISQQVEGMRDTLFKSGASSLLNLLQANDARIEMQRTKEFGENSLVESQHQISSLMADREAYVQNRSSTTSQEVVTARNSRDTAIAQLQKATKHQDLVELTAPEASVVLNIPKLSVGSVLKEGDPVLTLAPLRSPVEAEIHLPSRDIGFVRPGDKATLKIDAFNFFEHGTAEGKLSWVSEGSFTVDEDGKSVDPYYKARVKIDALHFTGVPSTFRLIPGMTLSADINVGTRSVFRYVMGGFFRGMGDAMREP